jgi:hypothetical protein
VVWSLIKSSQPTKVTPGETKHQSCIGCPIDSISGRVIFLGLGFRGYLEDINVHNQCLQRLPTDAQSHTFQVHLFPMF